MPYSTRGPVTVIGDAFIDVILPCVDIKPGSTYHRTISVTCGGTATTAVRIAKLGEKVSFLGRVGNDGLGKEFKHNLKSNCVKDLTVIDANHRTGFCVVTLFPDGERSIIADRGANENLTSEDIADKLNIILKSKIIYLSGYSLSNVNASEILPLLRRCREHGCQIWFNPGAPDIINDSLKFSIYQIFDTLIMNLDEAKVITGKDTAVEMKEILGHMANFSVITLGKDGCIVMKAGQQPVSFGTKAIPVIADTTGAGDAFSAGFISGRLRQLSDTECARLANETAGNFLKEKATDLRL